MNFFHIWLITIAASILMRIKNKLEIHRDIANTGYLLNDKKLEMLNEELSNEVDTITKILIDCEILIPFYNLLIAAIREDNYYKHTEEVIDNLKECGVLEEMTTEEKEAYNKRRTGFNAIKIVKKKWLELSKVYVVVFENIGAIWFDYKDGFEDNDDDLINNIIIIYSEGDVSKLSIEEQRNLVYNAHISMSEVILNNCEEPDKFTTNHEKDNNLEQEIKKEAVSKEEDHPDRKVEEYPQITKNKHLKKIKKRIE